jgi:hypothetical protein
MPAYPEWMPSAKSAGMTKKEKSFPNVLIGNPEKTD